MLAQSNNKTLQLNQQSSSDANQDPKKDEARQFLVQFKEFVDSCELIRSLQKFGKRVAPLQLIGTFLSFAGNAMLNDIFKRYGRKIFYGNYKAESIQQTIVNNQTFWLTEVVPVQTLKNAVHNCPRLVFKSRHVVLATGAHQPIHKNLTRDYCIRPHAQVFSSDSVLKQEGFATLVSAIKEYKGKCRIALLGGSHSAFSVLHLLLNGPCRVSVFEDLHRRQNAKPTKSKAGKKSKAS